MSDYGDAEGGLRDYLRADAGVAALCAQRVFFSVPDNTEWPVVTITRVGGGDDPSEVPLDRALLQIDCWGNNGASRKAEAHAVCAAVRTALAAIRSAVAVNGSTVLYGANVESVLYAPDPGNGRPRYAVTALVTARAA